VIAITGQLLEMEYFTGKALLQWIID